MNNMKKALRIAVVLAAFLALYSCNPVEDDSESASMLLVDSIMGVDADNNDANFLQSDVVMDSGSIRADSATATLRAETLDPDPILGASPYNDIFVTRYLVSYSRTDGKSVPGVDVPYPFEGSMSAVVKAGSTIDVSFVIVREVAKMEPPLIELVGKGIGDQIGYGLQVPPGIHGPQAALGLPRSFSCCGDDHDCFDHLCGMLLL